MTKCYYCNNLITSSNSSVEHIIPDSVGGKPLKSSKLLCNGCNSKFGDSIDAAISNQIGIEANLLNVGKDKSNVKIIKGITESGEKVYVGLGLKSIFECEIDLHQYNKNIPIYHLQAETKKEIIKKIRKILKKHIEDKQALEEQMSQITECIRHTEEKVYFPDKEQLFGGEEFFKAYTKIAINYYVHKQKEFQKIQNSIDYLKDINQERYSQFFYPQQENILVRDIKEDEVSNLIYLKGDTQLGLIYCYIELLATHNVLIILNTHFFEGQDFEYTYCYDLLNRCELNQKVEINLNREQFFNYLNLKNTGQAIHEAKRNRLMSIIEKLQKPISE